MQIKKRETKPTSNPDYDGSNGRGFRAIGEVCGITKKSRPSGTMSAIEEARHSRDNFIIEDSGASLEHFKWFIQERESIRLKKEAGEDRPWTDDEILNRTRFTNIFRQHDKVSTFIFDKCKDLEGPVLVYNLLLSRLMNRVDVISKFLPATPEQSLEFLLEGEAILMNSAAYQVSPGMVKIDIYETNRETIVYYPKKVYEAVFNAITSTTDIAEAVELGNKAYGGHIPFTIFQVVLDYHYLTGHYDDNSNIPIGQGAKMVLEFLGDLDHLTTELNMKNYDVEHAACEYRKYLQRQGKVLSRYSYKENSMGI